MQTAADRAAGDTLREFAYLDEVSVQSLLVSLVGALPAEVTSLTARSNESEIAGTVGANTPLIAKAELTSRFKGSATTSSQVLSRAVAESLFKHLYELLEERLVWSATRNSSEPVVLDRGALIEVEVELAPDPIYGFSSTMSLFSDLADDYPALLDSKSTATIIAASRPVNKVLERLLVGLIPIKAAAYGLSAGVVDGVMIAAPPTYFEANQIDSSPVSVVGVTEQEKYWRDVRTVLFSRSRFTILGRVSRNGVQASWNPVKLTEVMRDIAPQFPDMITRVGREGYSKTVNIREERNRDALEQALVHFAVSALEGQATERIDDIKDFARSQRDNADSLSRQGNAFDALTEWLKDSGILAKAPADERRLRSEARVASGLKIDSEATSLDDFVSVEETPEELPDEALLDLEIVAIYW